MDIIELLTKDHDEVDELFRRFNLAEKPETLDELGRQIVHELSVHAAVEELFVYPLARVKVEGGNELARHAIEEHAEVKRLLADIEKTDPADERYAELMSEVIDSVRHHVEEEQEEFFPKLKDTTDAAERERLGETVDKAKGLVPTHPHPLVPGTMTAQLAAGPWASLVDKVRDLVGS